MNNQDISLDLSSFDTFYSSVREYTERVPNGKYFVKINKIEITNLHSEKNKRDYPILKWDFIITDGPYTGCSITHNNFLPDQYDDEKKVESKIRWLKTNISRCNIELPKISLLTLPKTREMFVGKKLKITKEPQKNSKYSQIYFGKFKQEEYDLSKENGFNDYIDSTPSNDFIDTDPNKDGGSKDDFDDSDINF